MSGKDFKRRGPLVPKVRYPTYRQTWKGHYILRLYCERCRVKDGLENTRLEYGICSYCGWKGRCHVLGYWGGSNRPIRNNPKVKDWWAWRREPAHWSRNRKDR